MTKCGGILTGPWTAAERARGERVGMVESVKGAHQAARPRPLARAPQGAVQLGGQRRAPEQASQWYADRGGSWARRAPTQWPVAPMAYWAACRLQPHRTALALHVLGLRGFETYCPRLRERRTVRGRRVQCEVPLFPSYAFIRIELQWHAARWCPGVVRLVMDGMQPAKVPDAVIEEIRGRERNGPSNCLSMLKPRIIGFAAAAPTEVNAMAALVGAPATAAAGVPTDIRLRIWGSGVRIPPSAPTKSTAYTKSH